MNALTYFRPNRNRFRRYLTQAEADAFDKGYGDFRDGEQLATDAPPLTPERQAYRTGWFDAERAELDR